MGYRSDVMALFYCNDNQWPAMKLFVDENFPEALSGCLSTFKGKNISGFKFMDSDTKWYESYPEVQAFNEFVSRFNDIGDNDELKWAYEFTRIGEQTDDIEETQSMFADGFLYVSRSIEMSI